ncbi:MAG: molybdate ABC transporter substrate-binding protein [Candidatus Pacebacteria bacterium]|nr:molybdate ABC transporter substrate-binding protein [Candidatus Paceibacterota bacterium]
MNFWLNGNQATHCRNSFFCTAGLLLILFWTTSADAKTLRIAAAANLAGVSPQLAAAFNAERVAAGQEAITIDYSLAATGVILTQTLHGAPFDLFFSADSITVERLIAARVAVPQSRLVMAEGVLVLYAHAGENDRGRAMGEAELRAGKFNHLALANPATAPFGRAGREVLERLGLFDAFQPKLVYGNSVAQAYEFVQSGNAELGFVALSTVLDGRRARGKDQGSYWSVPRHLYSPLPQVAVMIGRTANPTDALAYLKFLAGPTARRLFIEYGYR